MKPITQNVGKPNNFDYKKDHEIFIKASDNLNFRPNNPIIGKFWNAEQIEEVGQILKRNISSNANTNREGASAAIYAMLHARGVEYEDLYKGNVDPSLMNSLYKDIKDLGEAEKEASKEDLTPDQREQAKAKLNEKRNDFFEDINTGLHDITVEFDKTCDLNQIKNPEHPSYPFNEKNRFYAGIISHSSTNYCEDPKFLEGMKKASEKTNLQFNGQPYFVKDTYDDIFDKCVFIGKVWSFSDSFEKIDEPEHKGLDCSVVLQNFFDFQVMLNSQFEKGEDRFDFSSKYELSSAPEFEDFFDSMGGEFDWNLFTKNAIKEGKLFSNIQPTANPEEIRAQFSPEALKKEKDKYVKTKMGKDMIDVVNRCIDKDLNEKTYSEEELDKGIEDPDIKAKIESFAEPSNSREAIKKSYSVFLKQLKNTSELDSKGEPAGNSPAFMDMYNKIKAVSKMEKGNKDFDKAYEESQKAINAYIKKRDGFIKIHSYGRDRLNIAKQMKTMNDAIAPRLKEATQLISDVNKEVKNILYHNEKTNVTEMSGGKKKEQLTKVNEPSLNKDMELGPHK